MYDQLEAKLHDIFWAEEGDDTELALLEEFLQQHPGTALELGCGSGRLLLQLLDRGYLMEGLDNSGEMLELCRRHAGDTEPVLHLADMADFSTGSLYSAITIPAFTLQFITPEKLPLLLENVRRHLHPGGGLYMTTFIPWAEITGDLEEGTWYPDHEVTLEDGNVARITTRFEINRLSQRLTREHRYEVLDTKGNVTESSDSTHHLHWFWPNELARILEQAGFTLTKAIGDFDADGELDENSQILTLFSACESEPAPTLS